MRAKLCQIELTCLAHKHVCLCELFEEFGSYQSPPCVYWEFQLADFFIDILRGGPRPTCVFCVSTRDSRKRHTQTHTQGQTTTWSNSRSHKITGLKKNNVVMSTQSWLECDCYDVRQLRSPPWSWRWSRWACSCATPQSACLSPGNWCRTPANSRREVNEMRIVSSSSPECSAWVPYQRKQEPEVRFIYFSWYAPAEVPKRVQIYSGHLCVSGQMFERKKERKKERMKERKKESAHCATHPGSNMLTSTGFLLNTWNDSALIDRNRKNRFAKMFSNSSACFTCVPQTPNLI